MNFSEKHARFVGFDPTPKSEEQKCRERLLFLLKADYYKTITFNKEEINELEEKTNE